MKKKGIALLLSAVMLMSLMTGCSKTDDKGDTTLSEYTYTAQYSNLKTPADLKVQYIDTGAATADTMYFVAEAVIGTTTESYTYEDENGNEVTETYEVDDYKSVLLKLDIASGEVSTLENYSQTEIPEGYGGYTSIRNMQVDSNGNIWIYEQSYIYKMNTGTSTDTDIAVYASYVTDSAVEVMPEVDYGYSYGDEQEIYLLKKLDSTGTEILSLDVGKIVAEDENYVGYTNVDNIIVDSEGNAVISDNGSNQIFVLNSEGELLFKISNDGYINGIMSLGGDKIGVSVYDQTTYEQSIKVIDMETKGYGETFLAPSDAWQFMAGDEVYDFYYQSSDTLYGYVLETSTKDMVLNLINVDINRSDLDLIVPAGEGTFYGLISSYNSKTYETSYELVKLHEVLRSSLPETQTLTYACMYLNDNMRSTIIDFNKKNASNGYRIEVVDYSQYNTSDDYSAGLTKLQTEIVSGKVPDILSTDSLPMRQYSAKGLFYNLYEFIDADTELGGRDALFMPLFEALEQDGELYQIGPEFTVMTAMALKSVVGDVTSWTVDDVMTAFDTLAEGATLSSNYMTRDQLLTLIIYFNLDEFVNWDTGECSFDSQYFIDLLNLCTLAPAEFDWEEYYGEYGYMSETSDQDKMRQGLQLFTQQSIYSIADLMWSGVTEESLEEFAFVGLPTTAGGNGNTYGLNSGLAISASTKYPEAAWEFVRQYLTEDFQRENVWSLPTNTVVLEEQLAELARAEYKIDPETGEEVEVPKYSYWSGDSDEPTYVYAMSEEAVDTIRNLLASPTKTINYDQNLITIVTEECVAFFAGTKSAEDTASMIQSRVSLYVNEQR